MKIDAVQKNSIPASIPANATPLRPVSFRGDAPEDTVEISGATADKKAKITAEDIKKKSEAVSDTLDAVADNIDKTTDSVTNAATKAAGGITAITAMFSKLIPDGVKEFFAPVSIETKKILDEAGKEIEQKVAKRKPDVKHIGIAVGVIAALAITSAIVKSIKNKSKQAQKAQQA